MIVLTKLDIDNSEKTFIKLFFSVEINCRTFEKQLVENG